jgi:predicted dinucleotide-binding enzyme
MKLMRVGVLGSGSVGKVLGAGFASLGHEVRIGTRHPDRDDIRQWTESTQGRGAAGSFAEAAAFGDLIVLATLGNVTEEIVRQIGIPPFGNKVVIDATNPIKTNPDAPPSLFISGNDSLGEHIQRALPATRVVKAFNTVGAPHMVNPSFQTKPDMFIAGNDDEAKRIVAQVCEAFGWGVADIGTIEGSRYLEAMCMAWVLYGIRAGSWNHAFKMVKA